MTLMALAIITPLFTAFLIRQWWRRELADQADEAAEWERRRRLLDDLDPLTTGRRER